ncbi:hypothetical protein [Streptomyces celluloflavus]|uniref:hypothetical protein n=1 Tax=Streptomyces celluloflavus TaxID=58344 RepID=UPI003663F515
MDTLTLALTGRAGARIAAHFGIATHRNTLLRRVMDLPDPAPTEPRSIGVDDFALHGGHVYDTVITDAVTHRVLDLLPERAGAYVEAADAAASQAQQVADCFHLRQNIANPVKRTVTGHRS